MNEVLRCDLELEPIRIVDAMCKREKDIDQNNRIMSKLKLLWNKTPELRFFQFLYNLQRDISNDENENGVVIGSDGMSVGYDFFNFEDQLLEEYLDKKLKEKEKK